MSLGYDLLLTLHAVSAAMLVALLVLVARNRREPLAPWLAGVFAALLLWTVAYIFELASASLAGKIAWANPQFVGATVMALLWLHAMRQAAAARRLPTWLTALLWVTCLTIITCVFVNPDHLFRGHPTLDRSGPIPFLDADYGPLYLALWVPFTYGLLVAALITLGRAALHGPQVVRARCRLLVLATVLPMLVGLPFIAGVLPWPNFNPAVSSLSLSAVLCAAALVRYRLLDLTPMARETVIEQLTDPLVVADARGLLCDFNPAASTVLPELSRRELGRPLESVLAGRIELLRALQAARGVAATSPSPSGAEATAVGAEDARTLALAVDQISPGVEPELRHYSARVTPVVRSTGLQVGEAIMLHDVTQSVRLFHEAYRRASTDELTGLLSRRRLLELGAAEVAKARRLGWSLGVLILDVDHFKLVNDLHGHAAGDAAMRAIGERCRTELRAFDLVGRYGGDEFCAILPGLEEAGAHDASERLRTAITGLEVRHEGILIRLTASIGVVSAQVEKGITLDELMRRANEALYEAKHAGRDRVAIGRDEPRSLSASGARNPS